MLKKLSVRKIMITTSALVVMALVYLFPVKDDDLKIEKNITYVDEIDKHEVFLIDKYDYVSMVTMTLNSLDKIDLLKEKIELLIIDGEKQNDVPNGFKPIIPNGTKILDLSIEEDKVTVNFSKELLNIRNELEEKMMESIVFTLTQEDNIEEVYVKVEGKILERLPNSNKLLPIPLTREYGVNKFYDFNTLHGLTMTTIYYIANNNDQTYYVPVSTINNETKEKISIIVEELKSSVIYQSNLNSYLSENVELLNYELTEEAMHLSFNDKIFDSFLNENILEEVEYSISLSVKENYDVKEVLFYVNDNLIMN